MRPGQNKRMRGRSNNNHRKGPNPLTRSYESNGPDVKIRGTAHHVAEKYLQLARDAQSSGDPVMAESYLQHAEHYFRIIATAQAAQLQTQQGYNRSPNDAESDDMDDDDDFSGIPDRFASPAPPERFPNQFNAPQPNFGQQPQPPQPPFPDRQNYNGNGQSSGGGHDRQQSGERQERYDRGPRQDRPYQDRQNNFRDRNNRDQRPNRYDGSRPERYEPRGSSEQPRAPYSGGDQPRQAPVPAVAESEVAPGLPSFITAPVRPTPATEPEAEGHEMNEPHEAEEQRFGAEGEDAGRFTPRPRRRRRSRSDESGSESAPSHEDNDRVTSGGEAPAQKETTED